jgi:GPI-anchor transamidase subunit S
MIIIGSLLLFPLLPGIPASDVVRTLEDLLIPPVPSAQAQFSPRYRLAFSLLNEDAAVGGAASAWAIEDAIDRKSNLFEARSNDNDLFIHTQVI